MLEFLLFIRSLFQVVVGYIYNNHIIKLRKYYSQLGLNITRNQRNFIIWPVSIAFLLSYPAIYSIFASSDSFETSYIPDLYNGGIGIQPTDHQNVDLLSTNPLSLKQIWLTPKPFDHSDAYLQGSSAGALEKDFLVDALSFQKELLNGINEDDNAFAYIHTPFIAWNNDLNRLKQDKSPLKALRRSSSRSLIEKGLLSGVVKINGLIKSAEAIRILIFYKDLGNETLSAGKIWDQNLLNLKNKEEGSIAFRFVEVDVKENKETMNFLLRLTKLNIFDHSILNISYLLITIYFLISLSNLKAVRSRIGLLSAFIMEILLSILSSATLTTYLLKGVDFYQIPIQFLPFVVVVVGIENTFRLVTSISGTPGEMSAAYRTSKALSESGITSTLAVIFDLAMLVILYPIVAPNTKQFFIFAGIALIIDHILHLTYFAAVLSVDIHRLELRDLLSSDSALKVSEKKKLLDTILGYRRQSLTDSFGSGGRETFITKAINLLKKIELPLSTTATGSLVVILFLIGTNIRWTDSSIWNYFKKHATSSAGDTSPVNSLIFLDSDDVLINFTDRTTFSSEIINLSYKFGQKDLSKVLISVYDPIIVCHGHIKNNFSEFSLDTSYKFDLFYVFEFLTSLAFILSIALLVLKAFSQNSPIESDDDVKKDEPVEAHTFQSKVLTGGHFLDIIKIETSRSPFIVSVGLDHKLLVWSPVSQPMPVPSQLPINSSIWPITHLVLSDQGNFVAVFSKSGFVQCYSRVTMTWLWRVEFNELKSTVPLEAFFRAKSIPAFLQRKMATDLLKQGRSAPSSRRNSMRSIASPTLGPMLSFTNTAGLHNEPKELVIVLRNGTVARISCEDGTVNMEKLSSSKLVSSAKLITPRVNDRMVSCTEDGNILLSTAVNNKWKTRVVTIDENKFNNPAAFFSPPPVDQVNKGEQSEAQKLKLTQEFGKSNIAIVPFVGFIVRTHGYYAEIIDVQTGILMKRFQIRKFKKDSLQVFHDQPTHCRFCGSVSITSFTVVYTTDQNTVVMHTFNVDHRAKTSICLRVERDPREIRCVGFNQVTEHQHELENVEGWSCTDKNQIVGIRRKTADEVKKSLDQTRGSNLRRRRNNYQSNDETAPRLHNLWEGWSMAANGRIDYYEIPDEGSSGGLLVNSVGQIKSFGHKAIVVAFGNIMKVLYLGNDNLIYNDEETGPKTEVSGLNFVNKRRRNLKKNDQGLSSMNFSEVTSVPGISELSL